MELSTEAYLERHALVRPLKAVLKAAVLKAVLKAAVLKAAVWRHRKHMVQKPVTQKILEIVALTSLLHWLLPWLLRGGCKTTNRV
jgi:hypothetical protein